MLSGDIAIFFLQSVTGWRCSCSRSGGETPLLKAYRPRRRALPLRTGGDLPANQRQNARLFTICLHFLLHLSSLLRTDGALVFCYNYIT